MDVIMLSKAENDYLLIKAQGNIVDPEEHKLLTKRFYNEIVKYRFKRIIINVSKINFPISFEFHNDIFKFYAEELPSEIKFWKIAVVDESSYRELGKYWEFKANQNGYNNYKVFSSMSEALIFIND